MADSGEPTGPVAIVGDSAAMSVRPLITIMYLCFSAAGLACLFFPSRAVASKVDPAFTYVWASFFLVGGLACLAGVVSGGWWGEMIGLPLVASSSLLYGAAVLIQYSDPTRRDGAFIFVGLLLLAQGLSLGERWVARWRLLRVAQRISREGSK